MTRPESLVEAIRETGYGAELPSNERTAFEEQEARDKAQEEEFRSLRGKSLVSLIAGVLASLVMGGTGYGLIGDIIVGIVGAFVGGWIATLWVGYAVLTL